MVSSAASLFDVSHMGQIRIRGEDRVPFVESLVVRSTASLFDVSHMGQIRIRGEDRVPFVESLVVGDIAALKVGEARNAFCPRIEFSWTFVSEESRFFLIKIC